jgi:tetratricopeptide (TPR) repeat protein
MPAFRSIASTAWIALVSLAPVPVQAQQSYDSREVRLLPVYCKYTQLFRNNVPGGNDPVEIERWTKRMGPTFIHMHHYCWGLMDGNRAAFWAKTPQDRTHNLYQSIKEFDYVIERAPQDFSYLPEILTRKGENLILLDKGPEGVGELTRAIYVKPDYWPPYAAISDYYKNTGDIAKAREWLRKGLSAAPDAKVLSRRLAELDGGRSRSAHKKAPE